MAHYNKVIESGNNCALCGGPILTTNSSSVEQRLKKRYCSTKCRLDAKRMEKITKSLNTGWRWPKSK